MNKNYEEGRMEKGEIRIFYFNNDGIDSELDSAFVELLESKGYFLEGTGYYFPRSIRDLGFKKREKPKDYSLMKKTIKETAEN